VFTNTNSLLKSQLHKTFYTPVHQDFEHAHGQFSKLHKFTVGKRISTSLIVALENIIAAIVPEDRRIHALSVLS
jgi:hypothetical protein